MAHCHTRAGWCACRLRERSIRSSWKSCGATAEKSPRNCRSYWSAASCQFSFGAATACVILTVSAGFAKAMQVFAALAASDSQAVGQQLLTDLLNKQGMVRFSSIVAFHNHVTQVYQFVLRDRNAKDVRPGGYHLFYVRGPLLMRVKTSGTSMHPAPHMTVSAATGMGWDDETMKLSRFGDFIPKQGAVPRASRASDWRPLNRLGPDTNQIVASDQDWADACHFDFVDGFDGSGTATLPVSAA
jgi:hypothetical protein